MDLVGMGFSEYIENKKKSEEDIAVEDQIRSDGKWQSYRDVERETSTMQYYAEMAAYRAGFKACMELMVQTIS